MATVEPRRVQYVKTSDGVNLAYYEVGSGRPFVWLNLPFSHVKAEWVVNAPVFNGIAANWRLIRYDSRGLGLSDREPADISLDAYVLDLETVADRLNLPPFILFASIMAPAVGVAFAARHPDRVSHLILLGGAARPVPEMIDQFGALFEASRGNWRFFSESVTRLAFTSGWEDAENSSVYAELLRESTTFEGLRRFLASCAEWDITELLPLVTTPTLVVNTKSHPWHGADVGREVASRLSNGQFAVADDSSQARFLLETTMAVRSFLGIDSTVPPPPEDRPAEPGTAIILFTDVAESTALTERLGDAVFRASSRALDERMRIAIRTHRGTPVAGKLLGDGVMGTFSSAAQAIAAACDCITASAEAELPLHIGIHAGDVIREDDNVYGGAVNIASRICGLCEPGEILVSQTVRDLARTSAAVAFEDRGEHVLKGIEDPVRVFALVAQ